MKKIIFLICIIVFTVSCKSTRQVTNDNVKSKSSINSDVAIRHELNSEIAKSNVISDKSIVDETVIEESVKTEFSKPDSTGIQFITSSVSTRKTTKRGEHKDINNRIAEKNTEIQKTNGVVNSDYKSDEKKYTKTDKITEDKTPAWITLGVLFLFLALFALSYLILKRYGLIK